MCVVLGMIPQPFTWFNSVARSLQVSHTHLFTLNFFFFFSQHSDGNDRWLAHHTNSLHSCHIRVFLFSLPLKTRWWGFYSSSFGNVLLLFVMGPGWLIVLEEFYQSTQKMPKKSFDVVNDVEGSLRVEEEEEISFFLWWLGREKWNDWRPFWKFESEEDRPSTRQISVSNYKRILLLSLSLQTFL